MPIYEYRCKCGNMEDIFHKIVDRNEVTTCSCCNQAMTRVISSPSMVIPDIQPYKAIAGNQPYITSRSQHRQFLKQNGLQEVGNEGCPE